ncbi:response regulator [Paraburkholderia xenovorans]
MIRVLLVDDEPAIVEALELALTEYGLEVRAAGNGARALESIAQWRPDLVLTDWMMPVMDGSASLACYGSAGTGWYPGFHDECAAAVWLSARRRVPAETVWHSVSVAAHRTAYGASSGWSLTCTPRVRRPDVQRKAHGRSAPSRSAIRCLSPRPSFAGT